MFCSSPKRVTDLEKIPGNAEILETEKIHAANEKE